MNTDPQHRDPQTIAKELRDSLVAQQLQAQAQARANMLAAEERAAAQRNAAHMADLEAKAALPTAQIVGGIEEHFHAELYLDAEDHICSKTSISNDARWVLRERKNDIVGFLKQRSTAWVIA